MGLDPFAETRQKQEAVLNECFNGGSPYFDFFKCGRNGVPIEDCLAKCQRNGIAIRKKDVDNFNNGVFNAGVGNIVQNGQLVSVANFVRGPSINDMKLVDFPKLPPDWKGSERRFFPCTMDNKPMQQWGWKRMPDGTVFKPELFSQADARALSPCGWVGQNMLYQPFIVMDIDGRGHGQDDQKVIEFGRLFSDYTFTMEDPAKPGSFHLYFKMDRLIPVKHFPHAKLDFMGNAVNAAVYLKNKRHNGKPMQPFTEEIWQMTLAYQRTRKEG